MNLMFMNYEFITFFCCAELGKCNETFSRYVYRPISSPVRSFPDGECNEGNVRSPFERINS